MPSLRSIDIDIDIHRAIETARRSFDEAPNEILRRLLDLPAAPAPAVRPSSGRAWRSQGVELPHGTELRMTYNGATYTGIIEDGAWIVEGTRQRSPSGAAIAFARTRNGGQTNLNGWNYWQVKRPGDDTWIALIRLWNEANLVKASA